MKITAVAPWFGSKCTLAPEIVRQLGPHRYYLEPFCGSLAVLLAKEPSANETVCDLHGALTNLAWVLQDRDLAERLYGRLAGTLYCEDLYQESKAWLVKHKPSKFRLVEIEAGCQPPSRQADLDWAYHYFTAAWMGRNGCAGTARTNYQFAMRWTANGGSGPVRFAAAVGSIPDWHNRLRNVCILRRDAFGVLESVADEDGLAIYADPPYLLETRSDKAGFGRATGSARYLFEFTEADHVLLATRLRTFRRARVVVSYYDHPQLRELYPGWTKLNCSRHKRLHIQNKRGAKRREAPEVLLLNGPAFGADREGLFAQLSEEGSHR